MPRVLEMHRQETFDRDLLRDGELGLFATTLRKRMAGQTLTMCVTVL